ncbi:hypothetical protein ALC62_03997 [Cyphomyrmex costatus]|uniref:Uncharacterized protein n=1 Tax=Cyphomyrmex costatus TaxID=456900 RepID=A0A151IKQ9_9HYME|nr:hypothetical protein ALC62_03997 [Cyphomyrmex costatus]
MRSSTLERHNLAKSPPPLPASNPTRASTWLAASSSVAASPWQPAGSSISDAAHCGGVRYFTGKLGVEFLHFNAETRHELQETVSVWCNMAARHIDTNFEARLALQLVDVLSSSSSSSDEDELWTKNSRKIPKIENFIDVVHNLTDKKGEESQPIKKKDDDDDNGDNYWMDNAWFQLTLPKQCTRKNRMLHRIHLNYASPESHKLSNERLHIPAVEDVHETPNKQIETLIKEFLQTRSHGQKYVNMLLGDREKSIDHVYGVYHKKNGTILCDKQFNVKQYVVEMPHDARATLLHVA